MSKKTRRRIIQRPVQLLLALMLAASMFLSLAQVAVAQDFFAEVPWDFQSKKGGEGQFIAIQSDGKIVVSGVRYVDMGDHGEILTALARFHNDGSLDTSYGESGVVTTGIIDVPFPSFDPTPHASSIAIQSGDKIIIAGRINLDDAALARYNPDGSLDTDFGSDGQQPIDFSPTSVAIQSNNKIVVAGNSASNFALACYNPDGSLDTDFGTDGLVNTDYTGGYDYAASVAILSNDKIVVVGTKCG